MSELQLGSPKEPYAHPRPISPPSPMAVGDFQLRLHDAAQAAAVRPVQPLPHHPQPIVAFLAIEGEVLHFGSDAPASPGSRASASRG